MHCRCDVIPCSISQESGSSYQGEARGIGKGEGTTETDEAFQKENLPGSRDSGMQTIMQCISLP